MLTTTIIWLHVLFWSAIAAPTHLEQEPRMSKTVKKILKDRKKKYFVMPIKTCNKMLTNNDG